MEISGFTRDALRTVEDLLYAEGQQNPLAGECGQKEKRKAAKQNRTPAQEQADVARAQANRGATRQSSAVRSEASKKAAETRKKCRGGASTTGPTTT
jgi:hypothetical protein